ncbi:MAG: DUF488 domain-containing protein [Candidatus Bathyarchaeia archaeon]
MSNRGVPILGEVFNGSANYSGNAHEATNKSLGEETLVWTIGYGGRSKEEFMEAVRKNGIQVLIDVRRFPRSKTLNFCRGELEKWLNEEGIEYVWLGEELGGYRRGGYKRHMETVDFERGIRTILRFVRERTVAVMCVESKGRCCHRSFIADRLRKEGIRVQDIE